MMDLTVHSLQYLLWIAGTLAAYWMCPPRARAWMLIGISALFLAIYSWDSLLALTGLALLGYFAVNMASSSSSRWGDAGLLGLAVIFLVYKSFISVEGAGIHQGFFLLGFSYYILRILHVMEDTRRGNLPQYSLEQYLRYLFFLPTLLVGPIHRFSEFLRDTGRVRWNGAMVSEGLERILYGYAKIVILANYLIVSKLSLLAGTPGPEHEALKAYFSCLLYGMNLYLQFAGFSDVAIGFSLCLGYRVMENFNWPFFQHNISEFWRSWHISLSSWCRDYIYMPVLAITRKPGFAAFCAMVGIGIWHELSLRYLLWGAYHGLGILVWQTWQGWKTRLPEIRHPLARWSLKVLSVLLTLHFVMLGFMLTKEETLMESWKGYQVLFSGVF